MKILQINNYHFPRGGSDRYFLNLTRELSYRGHHVQSFAPNDQRDTDVEFKTLCQPSGIDLTNGIPLRHSLDFFYSLTNRRAIESAIRKFRPNIAHLHIYYGQITPSIIAPLVKMGVPIVQTLHEYKIVCPAQSLIRNGRSCDACSNQRYWNAIFGRCNRNSVLRSTLSTLEAYTSNYLGAIDSVDRFIAVSHFQKSKLLNMGLPPSKIDVLYNFADIKEPPSEHSGDHFLFVGRLEKGKGVETLLKSYLSYRATCEAKAVLPLHVVGTGSDEVNLKAVSESLGLGDYVKWLGHKDGADLVDQYRRCRALINPSEFHETFGLTNLEAMSHGRPVLCSNSGAFPEVVRDGIDGYVLPAGAPNAFAERMSKLCPKTALKLGKNGFARANLKFSAEEHLKQLEQIYTDLIGAE
ncbi:glycosyltransferase family 4 protein [Planktomarina temperata]|nr:glycosyltransferase family 4 protein [Planktomarina temperata]